MAIFFFFSAGRQCLLKLNFQWYKYTELALEDNATAYFPFEKGGNKMNLWLISWHEPPPPRRLTSNTERLIFAPFAHWFNKVINQAITDSPQIVFFFSPLDFYQTMILLLVGYKTRSLSPLRHVFAFLPKSLLFLGVEANIENDVSSVQPPVLWVCEWRSSFLGRSFFDFDFFFFFTFTWTLDSGKFIFKATSSRINISGYLVLANNASRTSNCARVKVVLSLRCFLGLPETCTTLKINKNNIWNAEIN